MKIRLVFRVIELIIIYTLLSGQNRLNKTMFCAETRALLLDTFGVLKGLFKFIG